MIGRRRLAAMATAAALCGMGSALAQPTATVAEMAGDFVAGMTEGAPEFIIESARNCVVDATLALDDAQLETIAASDDYIAGINAVAAESEGFAEAFFPQLDDCGGTATVGEIMWFWVTETYPDETVEWQTDLGECLLEPIAALSYEGKRGFITFRFGGFSEAVAAMALERPDLAGDFIAGLAACGVELAVE